MRTDFLDFPTAWEIQRAGGIEHDARCSSVPGWHPLSGPGLLCDCGAVEARWEQLCKEQVREVETEDGPSPTQSM